MKRDIERIKKHLEEYNSLFPASKDKKRTQSKDDPEKISSDHYSRSKKKKKTVESPAKDDIFISKQVTVMRGTFEKIKRTKVKLAVKKKIYFTVFEQK